MEKTIGDNRKLRNGFITYFIVLIALGAVLIPVLPGGPLPLEIAFLILFPGIPGTVVWYITNNGPQKTPKEWLQHNWYGVVLSAVIILTALLLLMPRFRYPTDYLFFTHTFDENIPRAIENGRAFEGVLQNLFSGLTPESAWMLRAFNVAFLVLFGLLLDQWRRSKSHNDLVAFLVTTVLMAFSVITDFTAYASLVAFIPAVCCAGVCVILYDRFDSALADRDLKTAYIALLLSLVFLLVTFLLAQVPTMVTFVLLTGYVYFNRAANSSVKYVGFFALLFVWGTAIYFGIAQALAGSVQRVLNLGLDPVSSLGAFGSRLLWFFGTVVPGCLNKVVEAFFGSAVYYKDPINLAVTPYNQMVAGIFVFCVLFFFILSLVTYYKTRRKAADVILLLLFVPLAFMYYLVLLPTTFASYDTLGVNAVIVFIMVFGIRDLVLVGRDTPSKLQKRVYVSIISVLIFLLILNSNLFTAQFITG